MEEEKNAQMKQERKKTASNCRNSTQRHMGTFQANYM